MQLAIAAIGKVASGIGSLFGIGGSSTAATATTAGGTAAGWSGGQLLTSTLTALSTIGAGMEAAATSREAAAQAQLESGQEQVQSQQRQTEMKRRLLEVLGENDVTFAAAGIDLSSGIAANARQQAQERAVSELSIERRDSDFRRALYQMRAAGYRRRASGQVGGALIGALGTGAQSYLDMRIRGLPSG